MGPVGRLGQRFESRVVATDSVVLAVAGITVVALGLRFAFLGARVAHWDEARVAYWTYHYLQTGDIHYRFIVHGPFIQIVNRQVFALLGATDATSRAVVALVGGLLPATALLLRDHLRRTEVVVLALLLAANPILLYYSRFSRSSLLVAAFMFAAFGLFVRAYDTRRVRYVHAGVVLVALGFTAKENAAIYLLVWLGAAVLLVDHELFRPHAGTTGSQRLGAAVGRVAEYRRSWRSALGRFLGHSGLAGVLFSAVIVFFYAPRTGDPTGVGLWQAVGQPGRFPAVVDRLVADIVDGYSYWFGGAREPGCNQSNIVDTYLCFLGRSLQVLAGYGVVITSFGAVGFLVERYRAQRPRNLVMFAAYWGFASLLGYPLGIDIFGAWFLVNIVIPLAIPAAVALGLIYGWGREALDDGDRVSAGLAGLILLLVVGQVGAAGLSGVYLNHQDPTNDLVQYAQPTGDFRPALREARAASMDADGPTVVFYGEWLVDGQTDAVRKPACVDWFHALPLPWYVQSMELSVECATDREALDRLLADSPYLVITRTNHTDGFDEPLEGYTTTIYPFRASVQPTPPEVAVYRRTGPTNASA
jgi:uncharacterized protein (TIGR03663 family)